MGFERIALACGEKRTVTFMLPRGLLAFYDEKSHGFLVEKGEYEVMAGRHPMIFAGGEDCIE